MLPWFLEIRIQRIFNNLIKQNQQLVFWFCSTTVNDSLQDPESRVQRLESRVQLPESSILRPESSIQRPASRVQRPESSVQSSSSRVQRPDSSVKNPASRVQRSEVRVLRPESSVHRPEPSVQLLHPESRNSAVRIKWIVIVKFAVCESGG